MSARRKIINKLVNLFKKTDGRIGSQDKRIKNVSPEHDAAREHRRAMHKKYGSRDMKFQTQKERDLTNHLNKMVRQKHGGQVPKEDMWKVHKHPMSGKTQTEASNKARAKALTGKAKPKVNVRKTWSPARVKARDKLNEFTRMLDTKYGQHPRAHRYSKEDYVKLNTLRKKYKSLVPYNEVKQITSKTPSDSLGQPDFSKMNKDELDLYNFVKNETYDLARNRSDAKILNTANQRWEVDHIFPLRGKNYRGKDVPENWQVVPGTWNNQKGNRVPTNLKELFFQKGLLDD